ncbi:transposase domain-containing protein [Lactobacillus delbrueckii]
MTIDQGLIDTALLGAYEQVEYLTRKLYGKSSEKKVFNPNQLSFFE